MAWIYIELQRRDGETRRLEFSKPEVTFGRVQGNDVVLPVGNISKRHARLVLKDGKMIIVDLKSTNGTYVNGRKITSPLVIRDTDRVYMGDFIFSFSTNEPDIDDDDTLEVDVTELRLLANIAQHEEGSRMVYADWLEEHGDPIRAEFLRLQEMIPRLAEGSHFDATAARMRQLSESISIDWRKKVARPLIENCLGVELECPKDWGSLSATERPDVRYCGSCRQKVYYCGSIGEARTYALAGRCVAVDLVQIRYPHDLEPERPMRMGMIMPYDD